MDNVNFIDQILFEDFHLLIFYSFIVVNAQKLVVGNLLGLVIFLYFANL